tara:strand:+ start:175 stop:2385 length:2211 start_codon:yes stop_codon:yes gene_type:complete
MSTIRVVNVQHTDATEPNIVLLADGTSVFASGVTISGGTNLTVSGTAEFASGTVSAPGVTFIDDNNTGLYSPAADTVAITTAATERVRIDSSGRLLVGSTSNFASANCDDLQIGNTGIVNTGITIGSSTQGQIAFADSVDDRAGLIHYQHTDNSLRFMTNGAANERMRIDSSGNVGVGVTNPSRKLHINGSNNAVNFEVGGASGGAGLNIYNNTTANEVSIGTTSGSTEMSFAIGGFEKARIDSSGNVIVGTSSTVNPTLRILGTSAQNSFIQFADGDSNNVGQFQYNHPSNALITRVNGAEAMRITSSGNVGIGTASPESSNRYVQIHNQNNASSSYVHLTNTGTGSGSTDGIIVGMGNSTDAYFWNYEAGSAIFATSSTERMRIDSAGTITIGTFRTIGTGGLEISPNGVVDVRRFQNSGSVFSGYGKDSTSSTSSIDADGSATFANDVTGRRFFATPHTSSTVGFQVTNPDNNQAVIDLYGNGSAVFAGSVLVGKTDSSTGTEGITLATNHLTVTRSGGTPFVINRLTNDGTLINFEAQNSAEGSISVSGTTVSYNGGHITRWSQLPGGAERTEILRGSVLSNLDEMCEWAYDAKDAVLYTEDDELPEGVSVGDVKEPARDAGTEDNEQLNRMKVSDVEGDKNVSGVFQAWDDDDDTYTNDFYCAMTGDFVIRIAQGTTVARGDLLMSAGDGTAKPQDDDIVRSKTIAKVTSTTVSETYADGSYCVPCVLMAC